METIYLKLYLNSQSKGNPYHDKEGKFCSGPGKAFGLKKPIDQESILNAFERRGFEDNYTGLSSWGTKTTEAICAVQARVQEIDTDVYKNNGLKQKGYDTKTLEKMNSEVSKLNARAGHGYYSQRKGLMSACDSLNDKVSRMAKIDKKLSKYYDNMSGMLNTIKSAVQIEEGSSRGFKHSFIVEDGHVKWVED